MKLDILAFGAHPDDVELGAGGTVIKHIKQGKKVGIVDLTRGELGTRGSADLRDEEAANSAKIMGLSARVNLRMADGFFEYNKENQLLIVEQLRRFKPDVVLCNAAFDRHPDHGKGSRLVSDACFLAGLRRIETQCDGEEQEAWRPKAVYHYIQDRYLKPDFVVDVSEVWDEKMKAIMAFGSQFYNPESKEPISPIASKEFLEFLVGRGAEYGRQCGGRYGEGFTVERTPGVEDITTLK